MFLRNLFLQVVVLHSVLSSENDSLQFFIESTTQGPPKPYENSNQLNLEFDDKFIAAKIESLLQNQFEQQNEVANEIKNQIGELRRDILVLKDNSDNQLAAHKNNIETKLQILEQKQEGQLSTLTELKNQFFAYKNSIENLTQKLEQKQEEHLTTVLKEFKNEFAINKNLSEKLIQNQLQKVEEKQKLLEELLISYDNNTQTLLENLNNQKTTDPPRDCKDLQNRGKTLSGIYTIWPADAPKSFDVWCDMKTRGGGWTYVINRFDGSVDFNLKWIDYKKGFGDLYGEFWLGLENLYILTKNKPNKLLIELVDHDLSTAYAHYEQFSIGNEDEGYPIKTINGYRGCAGDDFRHHSRMKFTTSDRDHDTDPDKNCAVEFGGGLWFRRCHHCMFTGIYNDYGIRCRSFQGYTVELKEVRMMIKP